MNGDLTEEEKHLLSQLAVVLTNVFSSFEVQNETDKTVLYLTWCSPRIFLQIFVIVINFANTSEIRFPKSNAKSPQFLVSFQTTLYVFQRNWRHTSGFQEYNFLSIIRRADLQIILQSLRDDKCIHSLDFMNFDPYQEQQLVVRQHMWLLNYPRNRYQRPENILE